jgi:hypothetical protein
VSSAQLFRLYFSWHCCSHAVPRLPGHQLRDAPPQPINSPSHQRAWIDTSYFIEDSHLAYSHFGCVSFHAAADVIVLAFYIASADVFILHRYKIFLQLFCIFF